MSYEEYSKKFDEIYEKRIEPHLKEIEQQRLEKVNHFNNLFWLTLGIYALIVLFLPFPNEPVIKIIGVKFAIFVFGSLVILAILANICFSKLTQQVKKKFLPAILKSFGEFYTTNAQIITFNEIKQYKIFPKIQNCDVDDIITGFYKEMAVSIQETTLTHSERRGKSSHTVTDFKGLIIKVKFPKNFTGTTIVRPDKEGTSAGKLQKVNLEDPEFEKVYDVFSTDQIEARYLLTTAFMERLRTLGEVFANTTGKTPRAYCVFDKDYIMIFVNTYDDYFEVFSAFETVLNKENYRKVFAQMTLIFDIIHKLKIDLKIGL